MRELAIEQLFSTAGSGGPGERPPPYMDSDDDDIGGMAGKPKSEGLSPDCCPAGHKLVLYTPKDGGACDGCGRRNEMRVSDNAEVMDCRQCNW